MCGEIEKWQTSRQVCVRLVTNGNAITVQLGRAFEEVEEIRLDEVLAVGFNGAVSAAVFLTLEVSGFSAPTVNNMAQSGTMIMIDVLNPHAIYQRPLTVATAQRSTLSQFIMGVRLPNGNSPAFTEMDFRFTIVMRKPAAEVAEYRRQEVAFQAMTPQTKGADPRNSFVK